MGIAFWISPRAVAVLATCVALPALAQTPGYHLIGVAPGRSFSQATGVSADGRVVAGFSSQVGSYPGFIWSESTGRTDFGLGSGMPITTATAAISADGTTVAGITEGPNRGVPFRWSASGGLQTLGSIYGGADSQTHAKALSADGSVVVGASKLFWDGPTGQAFRWTQATGMVGMGYPRAGDIYSEATGISRDGSVITGFGTNGGGASGAFRWTQDGGFQVLPPLPLGPSPDAAALGMNFDGSLVVGYSSSLSANPRAVMWQDGIVMDLGVPLGWRDSFALDVSDDGNIVIGKIATSSVTVPAVWTATGGWATLQDYLASQGMPVPTGWTLSGEFSLSADGRTFVGAMRLPGELSQSVAITVPSSGTLGVLMAGVVIGSARRRRACRRTGALS